MELSNIMASEDNVTVSSPASIEHEFSSPWDDSDLILVVEDQQLHVHRFILKMASPVFKAMLSSDFKEKKDAKIPLPGKKADDFVVLLQQIYPQSNRNSITLANVEHIYELAAA
ncbi:uncharacterized protein LOC116298985, partial [Actinia tenebrosa]|uniref:Uncharacterized protein LOC116298985 n=1 Tax=Actinia tenebrosa TaxID=6105 RepID=A0A6P8ICI7_ACTTE